MPGKIAGKVLRNWTSLGEEWRFTYHDGYTEVTDVLGRTEQYHYDYNNELTKRVFADGSSVLMERDGLGRLLSHTDAMGRVTRYRYSNEGQVETIVRPDGAILHFDYDDCYRLIRKSDAEGRYDGYTYDEAGNLLTHTDPLKHTTRFEYADNGLLLSVTDPNGSSTAYHYNENRQPDLITDCSGYETKLAYTPEGQLARITDALGQHTEYHYDADQNLTLALYPDGSKETFGYDRTGNLTHSTDQRTGTTRFEYDKLGRITKASSELFAFDPAHNILDIPTEKVKPYPTPSPVGEGWGEGKTAALLSANSNAITDNRLKTYNGTTYYYDNFGNLIHRELADGEVQNYFYDLHDQLVKAEIFKKDGTKETWAYSYDALGRRIGKGRLKDGEVSDGLEEETGFVWDGSHLLQEVHSDGRYTYIYTDPGSYEPLAQVRDWTTEDGESRQQTHYFHCDQIGIPREITDKDGNLLWFGNYTGWGRLKEETKVTQTAHQPFRLQNQYCDEETGLHYNFFRYYEPDAGRFVNQDPIGLWGGENLYFYSPNVQNWIDFLGLKFESVGDRSFRRKVKADLQKVESNLRKSGDKQALQDFIKLKNDPNFVVKILETNAGNAYNPYNKTIEFNKCKNTGAEDASGSDKRPPFIGLGHEIGHEIGHAIDHQKGTLLKNFYQKMDQNKTGFPNQAEFVAVKFENVIRSGYWPKSPGKLRLRY